jgi:cyclopropane-fatty-acyl-phospholipid synthase
MAAGLARRTLHAMLRRIRSGTLTLRDEKGERTFGTPDPSFPLRATLTITDPRSYADILFGGSVGAAEAYMDGSWHADDLVALFRILARNAEVLDTMDNRMSRLAAPVHRVYHALRKNTPEGSRRNIAAHYDLGNDFYRLFLDETMTYSCGIFESEESTLEDAQRAKHERICRKLRLTERDRVLEIGGGWGGFALHAARGYGCQVTTVTISENQYDTMRERIAELGLTNRITVLLEDYRDIKGRFDKLVSIEMIEAVGHQYLDTFFEACAGLLAPEGAMLLQAITIADQRYRAHTLTVDFIKRYIFPGSCLTSPTAMLEAATSETDLRLFHLEDITPHYARTLRAWRERFLADLDAVRGLGFSEEFIRMWEYYLAYCEGAFAERYIGDVQALFTRPLNRMDPVLPVLSPAPPV